MSDTDDKQSELAKNFQRMMRTTKVDDIDSNQRKLASDFLQMMDMTRKIDSDEKQKEIARQFAEMMEQSRSFDAEREKLEQAGQVAVADAFTRMINLTEKLERENQSQFEFPPEVNIEHFPSVGDKFFNQLINKLPPRVRRFPRALRKNPRAVLKYFFAMVVGRVLAVTLYVIAAFIPALPIPDSVAGIGGKIPSVFGNALGAMRGFVTEFSMQSVMVTVTNIPTDINKLLQKIGEFFQFYGRRTASFTKKFFQNPGEAFQDIRNFFRRNAKLLLRLLKGALGVAFSFLAIKLAMVFLLPVFGGIAITVLGFKISIILIVIVRMAVSTVSEIVGKLLGGKFLHYCKKVYNDPEILWDLIRQNMDQWMANWDKNKK